MPLRIRNVWGELINPDNNQVMGEVTVSFGYKPPQNLADCKGTMTITGFKPEFHDKTYILKLEKTSGEKSQGVRIAPVTLPGFDPTRTLFNVFF